MIDDELVDIVDDTGVATHTVLKTDAHQQGLLHKTVIGYLKYGDDIALVRQAPHKQDAGQLVAPVGGHVAAGEMVDEAMAREAFEEIEASNLQAQLVGERIFRRNVGERDENHWFVVYEISTDDPIVLNDESVEITRFTVDELRHELATNPEAFGEAYYFVLESFYDDYLPPTYQRRWPR